MPKRDYALKGYANLQANLADAVKFKTELAPYEMSEYDLQALGKSRCQEIN